MALFLLSDFWGGSVVAASQMGTDTVGASRFDATWIDYNRAGSSQR